MKFLKKASILASCIYLSFILINGQAFAQLKPATLVNTFIGTGGHGHTFPGATLPFGMMQLSPDTRLEGWDGCGGYHYSDSLIYGFSHTHLSGTGVPDYCDVLLMPFTGKVQWLNKAYASSFSHKNEKASPGYYEVLLDKHQIKASLSTSYRSGMHQYQFQKGTEGKILLDLQHRDEVLESEMEIISNTEVSGMRRSKSWANNQILYFYLQFDQPMQDFHIAENNVELTSGIRKHNQSKNLKAYFSFNLPANKTVKLRIGISAVSVENAKANLNAEIKNFNLNELKEKAAAAWNRELSKVEVKGGTHDQQVAFYSALYHTMVSPNLYTDVDGRYRGTDGSIHQADGFTNYTVFSLWDTHRAQNPLQTILNRKRTGDWVNTFLRQYEQGGMLPVWELSGNETFCMIGYHSVPVIVDAYLKGIRNFDANLALKAMVDYAESDRFGLRQYMKQGFVGNDGDHESASKTVEYAFDDWCISIFAKALGKDSVAEVFRKRANNYKNLFDPVSKHIRGKVNGFWYVPFKASEVNNYFTEGNSWHYSFTAQQDLQGLIKAYGGEKQYLHMLDQLFTTSESLEGRDQVDVTGLIGQYAHGNEPSHHMAYLFNYVGQPWRTQELVHKICTEFYPNNPDGLIGNEDCGQMSAWLVMSAMGFYNVTPGSGVYTFGTPLFDEVVIHQENGKTFTIKAKNRSEANFYIQSARLNNKNLTASFIRHSDVEKGGLLEFEMGNKPSSLMGVKMGDRPSSSISAKGFTAVPYFDMPSFKFKGSADLQLGHLEQQGEIYYRIVKQNEQESTAPYSKFLKPVKLEQSCQVQAYAVVEGVKSSTVNQDFFLLPTDRSISVQSKVHPMYTAGGNEALYDSIVGTANWKGGDWQSYFDQDFKAIIDLKTPRELSYVGIHVLQDVSPWIVFPSKVLFETSMDGVNFTPLPEVVNAIGKDAKGPVVQYLGREVKLTARYVRATALTGGPLPAWHESAGNPTHTFIDEFVVR